MNVCVCAGEGDVCGWRNYGGQGLFKEGGFCPEYLAQMSVVRGSLISAIVHEKFERNLTIKG